jgi:hypothetical protein
MEVLHKRDNMFTLRVHNDEYDDVLREGFDWHGQHYTIIDGDAFQGFDHVLLRALTEPKPQEHPQEIEVEEAL